MHRQARGEKNIDGRADIYALGATLYHLLTGHTPFSGSSPAAVIMRHLHDELPDPRDEIAGLPDGVVDVLCRMMAKKPQDRYLDADALVADLELVAANQSPTGSAIDPSLSSVARRRRAVPVEPNYRMAYVVSAVVVMALVTGWWFLRPTHSAMPTVPTPTTAPAEVPVVAVVTAPAPPPLVSIPPRAGSTPAVDAPLAAANQGRTVDLLALADPTRDAVFGTWQRLDGALVSDAAGDWQPSRGAARLALPYRPPEEYDFRIVFIKRSGQQCVSQIFVARGQALAWVMGGWSNTVFAFENFNRLHGNEPGNITRAEPAPSLINGQRHEAVLQVRRSGATALLDGKIISRTPVDYREMTSPPVYHLTDRPVTLGIASWQSPTTFHVIEVMEISGLGTLTR